jgi:hypothetical protein
MPYRVTVDGEAFLTDDLTIDEAIAVEKATGTSWVFINPLRSADDCKAIMVAFLSRSKPRPEAEGIVGSLTIRDVLKAVERVDDDLPTEYEDGLPKAEAGTSTV